MTYSHTMSSLSESGIELSASQRLILQELVTRYRGSDAPVKGAAIASGVDRNPGTIRNRMQSLKALQLVEGIPGPEGGYRPTAAAFQALSTQDVDEPASVPLSHEGTDVETATVEGITLTSVLHPDNCRAEVELRHVDTERFGEGDAVRVGPTPCSDLRVEGVVEGVDDVHTTLVVAVESMAAPAEPPP